MKKEISFTLMLLGLVFCSKAQSTVYAHRMNITGVNAQWHSLILPNSVLAKTQSGLQDIRIYGFKGTDTIEVPYIVEKSSDQLVQREADFKVINESERNGIFYYTFQSTKAAIINYINLSFKENNFDWRVNLAGSNDNQTWYDILKDYRILAINNSKTDYQFTELNFPDAKYAYYRLAVPAPKKPELRAVKMLKTDTLLGITKPIAYASYRQNNDQQLKQSVIQVQLKNLELLSSISLNIDDRLDYYRSIKIETARDSAKTDRGVKYHYQTVYEGSISSLEQPTFRFEGTLAKVIRINIVNNDNMPLHLKSLSLSGSIYELVARFKDNTYHYALFFGNEEVGAPVYELKNFEQKIPMQLTELRLGQLVPNPDFIVEIKKPLFENKAWLWALMGLIISILGFFTYKMFRDK